MYILNSLVYIPRDYELKKDNKIMQKALIF